MPHVDPTAYVDESFQEHGSDGFYVLAAAIVDLAGEDPARQQMQALRGRRRTKLHWTDMDHRDRTRAAVTVRDLDSVHLVTIGTPVPPRNQERARRISLQRLAYELNSLGITRILLEARQSTLDRHDVAVIQQVRYSLPKGTQLRADHQPGADEPLFWLADIVAGAYSADRRGDHRYRPHLEHKVQLIEVDCT